MVLGQGLLLENIQGGGEPAGSKLLFQGGLIDHRSPADVDHGSAVGKQRQLPGAQQVKGFLRARKRQDQRVRLRQQVFPFGDGQHPVEQAIRVFPAAVDSGHGRGAEGLQPQGGFPSDVSGSGQQETAVPDGADGEIPLPFPSGDDFVIGLPPTEERKEHHHRMFRDGHAVRAG